MKQLKGLRAVALIVIAVVLAGGCARTRTNTYTLDISVLGEAERVRLLLDGREIAVVTGSPGKTTVSLDEKTPFPIANPRAPLTAEVFSPDGWLPADAVIVAMNFKEAIEKALASGEVVPIEILVTPPEPSASLRLYVDNRGRKEAVKISLGQAERSVAADAAILLTFRAPARDEGTPVRIDGVDIGRVSAQKVDKSEDEEQRKYGPKDERCWLVDVSGKHVYRRRDVVFQERVFSYSAPYKRDPGTILKSAQLYEIRNYQIDYFLENAPASIISQDLGVRRLELVDLK